MSWNKTGDERAKSFQVYKDLQKTYQDLQERYTALEVRIREKDEALLRLSRELYQALEGTIRPEPTDRPGLANTRLGAEIGVSRTAPKSERVPSVKPVQRAEVPMSELLGAPEPKRKEG